MEKRRVYQVAKEIKLSSDALISMLKSLGHEVRSHMSVVTPEMTEAITRKIEEEKTASKEEVQRQKEKEQSRRRQERQARAGRTRSDAPAPGDRGAGQRVREIIGRQRAPGITPLPTKEEGDRRRSKRRGKRGDSSERREPAGKPGDAAPDTASDLSGRWRGGGRPRRRRQTDTQSVQDNVRKTLSEIAEGRTRRRYDRGRGEEGEEGAGSGAHQIRVREFSTVGELADQMEVRSAEVIATCLQLGVVVTINQRLDMDTIVTVADEFGFEARPMEEEEEEELQEDLGLEEEVTGELEPRSPVVTVMGHVDHGKTSLLDFLRKTDVVEGESGGITQHIGAYAVRAPNGEAITFLDTPGHAAFTAMRARGARVTDLVILVVAADDDVMPQTVEAIDHAKAAQVPIVVAINKMDLPTADPDKVKRQLSERGVLLEDWGGKVPCAEISAITGQGIEKLLELVTLEAELLELEAVRDRRCRGTIIEAQLDKGRGPVATVLVQEGTLRVGDPFVTGVYGGRVRALFDEHQQRVREAGPSIPVQVLGGSGVPQAGDNFAVAPSEREAREIIQRRQQIKREHEIRSSRGMTLGDLQFQIQEKRINELKVIVKGDVDGSVEAITQELGGITHEEVRISVIHSGVGQVSESDVLLAAASDAIVIAFHVSTQAKAREIAARDGVDIRNYEVIYEVFEELRAALSGLLAPELQERVIGTLEIRQIFSSSRDGKIGGCYVQSGKITRNNKVRVMRDGESVFEGSISSLRRFKDDVREVLEGFECGVAVAGFEDISEGDSLEVLEVVEAARSL